MDKTSEKKSKRKKRCSSLVVEQVSVIHKRRLSPALKGKPDGRNSMSCLLVNHSSGYFRMHSFFYMGRHLLFM
jgi:hypothetical protein